MRSNRIFYESASCRSVPRRRVVDIEVRTHDTGPWSRSERQPRGGHQQDRFHVAGHQRLRHRHSHERQRSSDADRSANHVQGLAAPRSTAGPRSTTRLPADDGQSNAISIAGRSTPWHALGRRSLDLLGHPHRTPIQWRNEGRLLSHQAGRRGGVQRLVRGLGEPMDASLFRGPEPPAGYV